MQKARFLTQMFLFHSCFETLCKAAMYTQSLLLRTVFGPASFSVSVRLFHCLALDSIAVPTFYCTVYWPYSVRFDCPCDAASGKVFSSFASVTFVILLFAGGVSLERRNLSHSSLLCNTFQRLGHKVCRRERVLVDGR